MARGLSSRGPAAERWAWAAAIVALACFVVLGALFPGADPPTRLLGDYYDLGRELLVEAPAKAHEARNWALFGQWHRNPVDDYQFWRVQAPLWVYPLAGCFRLFGVSYATLRWFGLAIAVLGFVGWLRFGRHGLPVPALAAAAFLMASNVFVTQIARSGLVEIALNTAAVFMALGLLGGRRHPGFLVAAQLAFTAGFLAKAGMVYLLPLLVAWNIGVFINYVRQGAFPWLRYLPVLTAAGLAVGAGLYVSQPEYLRVMAWNAEHLVTGTEYSLPWYTRLDPTRIYRSWFVILPVAGALAIGGLLAVTHRVIQERGRDPWRLLLLLWALSAGASVLMTDQWTLRHSSVVLLPAYLLAGVAVAEAWRLGRPAGLLRFAAGGVVALAILVGAAGHSRVFDTLSYEIRDAAQAVRGAIGPQPAVIVGRFAMPVLLETPYDVYYVKPGFNTRVRALRQLGITHALRSESDVIDPFIRRAALPVDPPVLVADVVGVTLTLHPVQPTRAR